MKILIIGAGGREHALAWKFANETTVEKIFVAPGNAGIAKQAKCESVNIIDVDALLTFAQSNQVDLTVVGSEELLAKGIVDKFNGAGLTIWGPHQSAAKLEASKGFAKDFMIKHGGENRKIPTVYRSRVSHCLFTDARFSHCD